MALADRLRRLERQVLQPPATSPVFEIWVATDEGACRSQRTGEVVSAAELEERGTFTITIDRLSAPDVLGAGDVA